MISFGSEAVQQLKNMPLEVLVNPYSIGSLAVGLGGYMAFKIAQKIKRKHNLQRNDIENKKKIMLEVFKEIKLAQSQK